MARGRGEEGARDRHPLRCRTLKRAGALCLAFSSLGKGWGGREAYCGKTILGSDFHLLFTCWVLCFG